MGLRGLDLDKWTFSSTALVVAVVFGLFPLVSKLVQKNHHRGKVLVRAAHRDGATPVADSRARVQSSRSPRSPAAGAFGTRAVRYAS